MLLDCAEIVGPQSASAVQVPTDAAVLGNIAYSYASMVHDAVRGTRLHVHVCRLVHIAGMLTRNKSYPRRDNVAMGGRRASREYIVHNRDWHSGHSETVTGERPAGGEQANCTSSRSHRDTCAYIYLSGSSLPGSACVGCLVSSSPTCHPSPADRQRMQRVLGQLA